MTPDPYADLAAAPDVWVDWQAPLSPFERGRVYPKLGLIFIRRGLTQVQRRVTFRHEWAHLAHGDTGHEQGRDRRRADARADQAAAHDLIPVADLASCFLLGLDEHQAADELAVTVECLRTRLAHLHPAERALIKRAIEEKGDHL